MNDTWNAKIRTFGVPLRVFRLAAIAVFLMVYSAASDATLILDVDVGGTNRYNHATLDGSDFFVDMSGFGGWSLTIASALGEPDFSGAQAEIHLSIIASCGFADGCSDLTVTAASDNPGPSIASFVDFGFVPGPGSSGSFTAFTGDTISTWTESLGPWADDFEGYTMFSGAATGALWGLQARISAAGTGASSADLRITAVPEPGALWLFGIGLIGVGLLGGVGRRNPANPAV